jgi:two-component system LytT family response regulator
MIKAIIVDDEVIFSDYLNALLAEASKDIEVVATVDNIPEAITQISILKPQLVFLDMELPEISGIDFLKQTQSKDYEIIVTTSHTEFALDAIKGDVVDYLIKPIKKMELILAIQKVKRKLESKRPADSNDKIGVFNDNGFDLISKNEILYCHADNNYTHIHKLDGKSLLVSKTLKDIEHQMDNPNFFRVNKSFLVNIQHIKRYVITDGGSVVMQDDSEISVSPSSKDELISKLHLKG